MVSIKKKKDNKGNVYYYIQQTIRKGKRVEYKEKYLGKHIPKNIEELKIKLFRESYKELYNSIDSIKNNYNKELKIIPKSIKEKSLELFVTRFTYDTQRIEGSTLSLRDTANLLEKGITPKDKPIVDIKEAEGHKKLFHKILDYQKDLSYSIIVEWHTLLFKETKQDIAGKIRKHKVGISGSKFIPPLPIEIYPLLKEFFKWHNKNKEEKLHPVELAALVHLKFVTIHPFSDGNGRISRLMMNFVLNKKRYPMFNIPYEGRNSYYNALERSQIKGEWNHFLLWFIKNYIKGNK